ncbi:MAG: APC family permease [Phycisphaerae bacterium]
MAMEEKQAWVARIKELVIGGARNPFEQGVFHKISLIAFFAWVGLGADGLSSSCYGPSEAFMNLKGHNFLAIFVGLGTVLTIFVVSSSYSQIIELFPTGGGGYLVASKLLSPTVGMISGCALLIDYVLTITISIASGADAIFSFLPASVFRFKIEFAILGLILLTILNMRGVRESVLALVPIFLIFVISHVFVILYAMIAHAMDFPAVVQGAATDIQRTRSELGLFGMIFIILRAYSMGAGTYTGIEAVSNGLPILREPKVQTGKRTMHYMAISLSFMVMGLMLAYLLYNVHGDPESKKTLNAVLFESVTAHWPKSWSLSFIFITLVSEAAILFVAAQAGFLDGPRVLANMALDRWMPTRFAILSDRLVTQNGILLMGVASLIMMAMTKGRVDLLIVLYSINVFITFSLSQLGMVRHWWLERLTGQSWKRKFGINGIGLVLTLFILFSVTIIKFNEGGWITLVVTGSLVGLVALIKKHYDNTGQLMRRLDGLVYTATSNGENLLGDKIEKPIRSLDPDAKTAVLLVNGFNGLGLHTLFSIIRLFGDFYKNFIFVQVGVIDAGNFKGSEEVEKLQEHIRKEVNRYVEFMGKHGYYAEGITSVGIDIVDQVTQVAPKLQQRFPQAVFFGGQLVFPKDTVLSRWLHNYIAFSVQRRFYRMGIPFVVLPIRV